MEADGLTELDVAESILNAVAIYKTLRSQSPWRQQRTEYLHVIQSTNLDGLMIYTKALVSANWLPDSRLCRRSRRQPQGPRQLGEVCKTGFYLPNRPKKGLAAAPPSL